MIEKRVSVIIPSYNGRDFIEEALDSIGNQTYTAWEVIVVEDGTQDGTKEICEKFSKMYPANRFTYIRHEKNQGVGPARNTALNKAQGEYLAFLDCDDFWRPQYLQFMVAKIEKEKADIVFSSVQFFDHASKKGLGYWGPTPNDLEVFEIALFERNFIAPSGVLMRKKAQELVGEFDIDPLIQSCEDHDFWLRCLAKHLKFTYLNQTYSWYRRNHGGQATDNLARTLERDLRVLKKHKSLAVIADKDKRAARSRLYTRLAYEKRKSSRLSALTCVFKALVETPSDIGHFKRMISVLVK